MSTTLSAKLTQEGFTGRLPGSISVSASQMDLDSEQSDEQLAEIWLILIGVLVGAVVVGLIVVGCCRKVRCSRVLE